MTPVSTREISITKEKGPQDEVKRWNRRDLSDGWLFQQPIRPRRKESKRKGPRWKLHPGASQRWTRISLLHVGYVSMEGHLQVTCDPPNHFLILNKQRKEPTRNKRKVKHNRAVKTIKGHLRGTLKVLFHRTLRSLGKCKGLLENIRLPADFCLGISIQPSQERYTGSWTFP